MPRDVLEPTIRVRKFEPGACGLGSFAFLQDMGYGICQVGKSFKVWAPGKKTPTRMRTGDLMKLIDDERLKRGLEPIQLRVQTGKQTAQGMNP